MASHKRKSSDHESSETLPKSDDGQHQEEEYEEEDEEEDIVKLLAPISKDQLISLLRSAASANPRILPEIHRLHCKIFVHGLSWETTVEGLRAAFSPFGDIEEGPIGFDRRTGKPKGFALFIYRTAEGARKALEELRRPPPQLPQ